MHCIVQTNNQRSWLMLDTKECDYECTTFDVIFKLGTCFTTLANHNGGPLQSGFG